MLKRRLIYTIPISHTRSYSASGVVYTAINAVGDTVAIKQMNLQQQPKKVIIIVTLV